MAIQHTNTAMKTFPEIPMQTREKLDYEDNHLRGCSGLAPAPWCPEVFAQGHGGVMYEKSEHWEKELQAGFVVVAVDQPQMD